MPDRTTLHDVLEILCEYHLPELGAHRIYTIAALRQSLQPIISTQEQLSRAQLVPNETHLGYSRLIGDKQADLRLFREWLRLCDSTHPICQRSGGRVKVQPQQLWVVNVRENRVMKAPLDCRYLALSYVWGPVHPLRLTKDTKEIIQREGALQLPHIRSRIPQTIQDAMVTALAVNIEFLWVDTLCIPQDDRETKQELMQQMHLIYDNAVFTIVAAAGDDANRGLPGIRPGSRDTHQSVWQIGGLTFLDVEMDPFDGVGSGYQPSRWGTRAWT
ncbi:heterokaryon incompatibility protein-domain-containing protein, partial [Pseudomassariella vexata]